MKKTAKQILSVLLCMCMLMSCMGLGSVYAVEDHDHVMNGMPTTTWASDYSACTLRVSCTVEGCDYFEEATVPATTREGYVAPTCTEAGSVAKATATFRYPKAFSPSVTNKTIKALGHDWGEWSTTTAASCSAAGEEKRVCARCGVDETRAVDQTAHVFGAWTVETDPSCTAEGKMVRVCTNDGCEVKEEVVMPVLGHTYSAVVTAATCTDKGSVTYTCDRCGDTKTEELAALGHSFDETIAENVTVVDATCTADGSKTVKCARCDQTQVTPIAAFGHSFDETITANVTVVDATCTADGSKTVKCSRCDQTQVTPIAKLDHSFDETVAANVTIVPATCTADGSKTVKCTRCDQTQVTPIAKLDHSFDETITENVQIDPATCTADGSKTVKCARCGQTQVTPIAKLGHSYNAVVTTPATCEAEGVITYTCSRCSDTYTEKLAKLDHSFDETVAANVTIVPATCTADGSKTVKCTRCDKTQVTPIAKLGHSFDDTIAAKVTVVDATCTGKGSRTVKCARCDAEQTIELTALGHDFQLVEGSDAGDMALYRCTRCGEEEYRGKTSSDTHIYPTYNPDYVTKKDLFESFAALDAEALKDALNNDIRRQDLMTNPKSTEVQYADYLNAKANGTQDQWEYDNGGCGIKCTNKTDGVPHTDYAMYAHAWEAGDVVKQPTCTETGLQTFTCNNCGTTVTAAIEALGHSYNEGVVTEPTCEEKGYTTYTCTRPGCSHSYTDNVTNPIGHNMSDPVYNHNATFFRDGTQTSICLNGTCTYTETTVAPHTNRCDVFFDNMITNLSGTNVFFLSIPINALRWFVKLFAFGRLF